MRQLLQLTDAQLGYGDQPVLSVPSLSISPCSLTLIRGGNGSGKSTLFKAIAGINAKVFSGSLCFDKEDLKNTPAHLRAKIGIRFCPQGRNVFPRLNSAQHLRLARASLTGIGNEPIEETASLFPKDLLMREAEVLSGGESRILLIQCVSVAGAKVLLLDEPFASLDAQKSEQLLILIQEIYRSDIAILLADHTGFAISEMAFTAQFIIKDRQLRPE